MEAQREGLNMKIEKIKVKHPFSMRSLLPLPSYTPINMTVKFDKKYTQSGKEEEVKLSYKFFADKVNVLCHS